MKVGDLIGHKGWIPPNHLLGVIVEDMFLCGEYFRVHWFDESLGTSIIHNEDIKKLSTGE